MEGVRVISSVAVFLFVLLASFGAAREERAGKRAEVTEELLKEKYNYFAVLAYGTAYCSGTITSTSTVLTYCPQDPEKAYAGLVKVAAMTNSTNTNKQESKVQTVKKYDSKDLRLCIVENKWNLTDYVGIVTLPPNARSARNGESCEVLGFVKASGAHQLSQKIGGRSVCKIQDSELEPETDLLYSAAATAAEVLATGDQGGPAVCGDKRELRGITVAGMSGTDGASRAAQHCNWYINVTIYRPWIDEQIKAADAEAAGGPSGTGGNGTASSGYSIHSHLNKYSNWKVLWFLVPPIVTFLRY